MNTHTNKTSQFAAIIGGVCLTAAAMTLQGADGGPYVKMDAGANIIEDVSATVTGFGVAANAKISADPGLRWNVAAGYAFPSPSSVSIAAEFESGLLYNPLKSVSAAGGSASVGGDYYQVPFMANLVLTLNSSSKWAPYLGVGGGGVYSSITIDSVAGAPVTGATGSETDGAVQAMAGLRYKFNDHSEFGLSYKYMLVFTGQSGAAAGYSWSLGNVGNHSISLSYSYRF
jgi:opacity protein-like surface antigen